MFKKLVKKGCAFAKTGSKNREELFREMADRAVKLNLVSSAQEMIRLLEERENQGSTEIAPGIAMPHIKNLEVKEPFIFVATSKAGIKYHGFSKVNLVFLLATPDDNGLYMTMMAKIARLLKKKEFVDQISKSDVAEDILTALYTFEERLEIREEKGQSGLYLVALTLNHEEEADIALSLFIELGIRNPTVFRGEYLIEKLQNEMPIFSPFSLGKKMSSGSKTILGVSPDAAVAEKLFSLLKQEDIDLWKPGKGMLFSLPVNAFFGGLDPEMGI